MTERSEGKVERPNLEYLTTDDSWIEQRSSYYVARYALSVEAERDALRERVEQLEEKNSKLRSEITFLNKEEWQIEARAALSNTDEGDG